MIHPRTVPAPSIIADHYDELDWAYREVWGEHVHHGLWLSGFESPEVAVLQLVRHVARLAEIRYGDSVCDVGCGYGATARLLAQDPGARVVGITLSGVQHRRATAQSADGATSFVLGDWLSNAFDEQAFDAVIAIESVEHMADKLACFREAWRVLRPGGRFAFTTWLEGRHARAWERRWLLEPICREGRLPSIGTCAEYRKLLAEPGFELIHEEDLSDRVKPTWSVCASRVAGKLLGDARYRRFALSAGSRNRVFAVTLARMWLAFETGAMQYGSFACRKPGSSS